MVSHSSHVSGCVQLTIDPPKGGQVIVEKPKLVSKKMQMKQKEMVSKKFKGYSEGRYDMEECLFD